MRASAPASSANLGPGFDCLALALDLRVHVEVAVEADWEVLPGDPDGFVESAARGLSKQPLRVNVDNHIPVGRGLGSSAAVLAALAAAIRRLEGTGDDLAAVYEVVSTREGHPDNAAATVYGGLVHARPEGVAALEIHSMWHPVVAVPDASLPTSEARAALPDHVPFAVAVRTASRVVRLVEALRTGDSELLKSVGPDELHEPYRVALRPVVGELMGAARSAGAPFVAMSGAGPSVLALTTEAQVDVVKAAFEAAGSISVLTPGVAVEGVG